jgi:hypothetical protein
MQGEMIMNEKPSSIPMEFWRRLAADSDLVCNLCHHFQELSSQNITGEMPGCLLKMI